MMVDRMEVDLYFFQSRGETKKIHSFRADYSLFGPTKYIMLWTYLHTLTSRMTENTTNAGYTSESKKME